MQKNTGKEQQRLNGRSIYLPTMNVAFDFVLNHEGIKSIIRGALINPEPVKVLNAAWYKRRSSKFFETVCNDY